MKSGAITVFVFDHTVIFVFVWRWSYHTSIFLNKHVIQLTTQFLLGRIDRNPVHHLSHLGFGQTPTFLTRLPLPIRFKYLTSLIGRRSTQCNITIGFLNNNHRGYINLLVTLKCGLYSWPCWFYVWRQNPRAIVHAITKNWDEEPGRCCTRWSKWHQRNVCRRRLCLLCGLWRICIHVESVEVIWPSICTTTHRFWIQHGFVNCTTMWTDV